MKSIESGLYWKAFSFITIDDCKKNVVVNFQVAFIYLFKKSVTAISS